VSNCLLFIRSQHSHKIACFALSHTPGVVVIIVDVGSTFVVVSMVVVALGVVVVRTVVIVTARDTSSIDCKTPADVQSSYFTSYIYTIIISNYVRYTDSATNCGS